MHQNSTPLPSREVRTIGRDRSGMALGPITRSPMSRMTVISLLMTLRMRLILNILRTLLLCLIHIDVTQ